MMRSLNIFIVFIVLILNGCINDSNIYLYGTEKYENKIASFKVTPEEAAKKIIKYKQSKVGQTQVVNYPGLNHYIVIDDYYVFSKIDKTGISISGIYVNGYTGEVEERDLDSSNIITPSMQKRLWGKAVSMEDGYIFKNKNL